MIASLRLPQADDSFNSSRSIRLRSVAEHIKHPSCRIESDGVGLDAAVFFHVGQDGASPEPLQSFGACCHLARTGDDARKVLASSPHLGSELLIQDCQDKGQDEMQT